ncbi:MAG: hypothetical protein C4560_02305 [Nitrospiraceae bacterium]|nr:MAG: hypothetical protein C4560_02305 [Nitrospiraceae bacterium]
MLSATNIKDYFIEKACRLPHIESCPANAVCFDHPVLDDTFPVKGKAVFACATVKVNESAADKINVSYGCAPGADYLFKALPEKTSNIFFTLKEVRVRQN